MNALNHHIPASQSKPFWRRLGLSLLSVFVPPLAAKHHGRYQGKQAHLFFDTVLALLMFFLAGWIVFHLTSVELPPNPGVRISLRGTPTVVSNNAQAYSILIENTSTSEITDLVLEMAPPPNWRLLTSTLPPQSENPTIWHLPNISVNGQARLDLTSQQWGEVGDQVDLRALLQYTFHTERLAATASLETIIDQAALSLTALTPSEMRVGERFEVTAELVNVSAETISQAEVLLSLPTELRCVERTSPGPNCDRLEINDWPSGATQRITWTVVGVTATEQARLSVEGILLTSLDTSLTQVRADSLLRLLPEKTIEEIVNEPGEGTPKAEIEFAAEAHYYGASGVQFGYGPLPPRVGQTTGYRIFWVVRNPRQSFQSVTIAAAIPPGAEWAGNASVSLGTTIQYRAADRSIHWSIGDLDPETEILTGSFDITLNPAREMAGQLGRLLTESVLEGKSSHGPFSRTKAGLTTALSEQFAQGKERIQP